MSGGESRTKAQVSGARVHALPPLWQSACRLQEVRPVPDLFPGAGPAGRDSRRHQGQLVGQGAGRTRDEYD